MKFTRFLLLILLALPCFGADAGTTPSAFSLLSPLNRSASESTTTVFSWDYSSSDATYTLEVATAPGFGATNVVTHAGLSAPSYTLLAPLSPGVVYFWRVTASNSGGTLQAANGPFEFSAPIVVGSGTPGSLAVTPDGSRVLVARGNSNSGYLADISLAGHAVTQAIAVGNGPAGVSIRSDGQEAVVANAIGHSISVVNLINDTVKATIAVPCVATTLYDLAYTPDGTRIVFPDLSSSCTTEGLRMIVLATQAQSFVNIVGAGQGVAVMPNGDSVLNTRGILGTTIRRMNLASSAVATISNTSSSFGVAVTPDSRQALVAAGEGDTIKRIDLATNSVVGVTNFGSNQNYHSVAITPDGSQAVVVGDFATALISLTNDTVVTQYPVGGGNVVISPDGKFAYISAADDGGNVLLKVIRITGADTTALKLLASWNLVGNGVNAAVDVATTFGNAANVATVWKWVPSTAKWAFYTPSLVGQVLTDYANSKGYDVLTTIAGGEGYWVNANQGLSVNVPNGSTVNVSAVGPTLVRGWNLVSVGESATPKQFCDAQSAGVTTLWAWDATRSSWYFYAPALDTSGGLTSYVNSKGYLDFTANSKTLGPGVGFWVNKP
jgi:DNA-binding beta-propeller fold protein YncE